MSGAPGGDDHVQATAAGKPEQEPNVAASARAIAKRHDACVGSKGPARRRAVATLPRPKAAAEQLAASGDSGRRAPQGALRKRNWYPEGPLESVARADGLLNGTARIDSGKGLPITRNCRGAREGHVLAERAAASLPALDDTKLGAGRGLVQPRMTKQGAKRR